MPLFRRFQVRANLATNCPGSGWVAQITHYGANEGKRPQYKTEQDRRKLPGAGR